MRLDELEGRPVTWITAPPGAGKTTLVASYLQQHEVRSIWYQMNRHDAEAATFFHYLAVAADAAGDSEVALPPFTAEYFGGVDVYARNFFSALADQIGVRALVLDDIQNLPEPSSTREVMASVLAELPRDIRVFIVSRSEPTGPFARLMANGAIGVVRPAELMLSQEEVEDLLELLGVRVEVARKAALVHQKTSGWAAGCVLAWDRLQGLGDVAEDVFAEPSRRLTDYFSREVLGYFDDETLDVLLRTAFLPSISAKWAVTLTDNPDAPEVLERLVHDHYFTLKRSVPAPLYQLHPLFAGFLKRHAQATLGDAQVEQLMRRSAELLAAEGQMDAAVDLWSQIHEWHCIESAVLEHAEHLLATGRNETLQAWIASLPEPRRAEAPWIQLWLGTSYLPMRSVQGRAVLADAWEQLRKAGDVTGALLAWAGVSRSYHYQQDFSGFHEWVVTLEQFLGDAYEFPTEPLEAVVLSALVGNLWIAWPDHPERRMLEERAEQLANHLPPIPKAQFHSLRIACYVWSAQLAKATITVRELHSLSSHSASAPLERLATLVAETTMSWFSGEWDAVSAAANAGLELSSSSGVHLFDATIDGHLVARALSLGQLAEASEPLERMRARTGPNQFWDYSHYHAVAAWHALLAGEHSRAAEHNRIVRQACHDGSMVPIEGAWRLLEAILIYERGDLEEAEAVLRPLLPFTRRLGIPAGEMMFHLTSAGWALDRGARQVAADYVARALRLVRERRVMVFFHQRRDHLARLLAFALEEEIEVQAAREMIDRLALEPPPDQPTPVAWPRPLWIKVLGSFHIERNGESLESPGKAQRRPLRLLQTIIAFGGDQVQEWLLTDALWPDSDGSAADKALATTLHRLRALLGDKKLIKRRNGLITLNRDYCWIDLWELEDLLEISPEKGIVGSQPSECVDRVGERLLSLYQPFLGSEEATWASYRRQRIERRVMNALRTRAAAHLRNRRLEWAIRLYEGAVMIDELAEDCYRGLMSALVNAGRRAEALASYDRCKGALRDALDTEPSEETTELFREIRGE